MSQKKTGKRNNTEPQTKPSHTRGRPKGLTDEQQTVRILDAAMQVFRKSKSGDFNIGAVAKKAGVSLRTVYEHFENKEALLAGMMHRCLLPLQDLLNGTVGEGDMSSVVTSYLLAWSRLALSSDAVNWFRIAVMQHCSTPEFGRTYYAMGMETGISRLSAWLQHRKARNKLSSLDPETTARFLAELVISEPLRRFALGLDSTWNEAEMRARASSAVALVLGPYVNAK
jgi:AcrR family transcriptional regulator